MPEGFKRWDELIYTQEGLDKNELHQDWKDNNPKRVDAVLQKEVDKQSPYIIPPISHVVYFTDPQNPKPWKQLYINKYIKTTVRLNEQDPNMKHYIWTNDVNTVPAEVRALPNVEVRTFDEFQNHDLMPAIDQLVDKAKTDPSVFVQASDVARVVAQQKYGGIYHDLDYEIFDAAEVVKYMKQASFVGAKEEEGRFDSFMGNALIISTPSHPIINELARKIKRNLYLEADVPDYIRYPYNKFDSIICSTGPMALTLSYFKIQEEHEYDNTLAPMLMMPARVLYSVDYARREIEATMQDQPPLGAVGGDMFSGGWGTSEYLKPIDYQEDVIENSKMRTLYSALSSYGFDIDQVKNAKCFASYFEGYSALKVIQHAYTGGTDEADKKARAQLAFSLIKDMTDVMSIIGVGEYGIKAIKYALTPEQVKAAKCFSRDFIAKEAIRLIEEAEEHGVDEADKKAKVQIMFHLIQDIISYSEINAVGKYGFDAVLYYGLTPEQVKGAKCFRTDVTVGEVALEFLDKAYEGSEISDKKANALKVFDLIKDLYRKFEMELVVKYGFTPDQIKNAPCFQDYSPSEVAFKLILEAYNNGSDEADKKAKAQALFALIQDLDNAILMKTIGKYGLTKEQLQNAKCLRWTTSTTTFEMLEQAYAQGTDEADKKAKVQILFSLIQDLDELTSVDRIYKYHFNAVVKYGLPPEQVKNAKCLSSFSVSDDALNLIKQAYDRGSTEAEKIAKAQEVFGYLKDIDDFSVFMMMTQFGILPEQVKDAKCIKDEKLSKFTLIAVAVAFRQGSTEDEKAIKARALFNEIRDIESPIKLEAISYGLPPEQVKNAKCFSGDVSKKAIELIVQTYNQGTDADDKKANAQALFSLIKDLDNYDEMSRKILEQSNKKEIVKIHMPQPEEVQSSAKPMVLPHAPQVTTPPVLAIAPESAVPNPPPNQPLLNLPVTMPELQGTLMLAQALLGIENPQPTQAKFDMPKVIDVQVQEEPAVNWIEAVSKGGMSHDTTRDWSSAVALKPNESGGDMPPLVGGKDLEKLKSPKPEKRDRHGPTSEPEERGL